MKSIFYVITLFACINGFSQENIERTKRIAAEEKQRFATRNNLATASLASNNFEVYYYRCNWNINPAVRQISGSVTSYFRLTKAAAGIVYDFTNQLTIDSIIFRKKKVAFTRSGTTLAINFPSTVISGKKDSVTIHYRGTPPNSQSFGGFVQTTHNGVPVLWTLSEPYDALNWWPCRNGLDDKADSIDIYITHPSQYKAAANGILKEAVVNGNSTTSHYAHRYPVATYLVAFAVTNYIVYTSSVVINGQSMPVIQHIYPEDFLSFSGGTAALLSMLQLYSTHFGSYPFVNERYGQTQFSWGGGMEHQTNSFINNSGRNLVAHELGHQWFGDRVTCGSWRDIWLNEGFATWLADMFYTEKIDTNNYKAYVQYDLDYIVSSPGGSVWVDDTTSVNRIFDGRLTYNKGAFLLRMLRWTLGDSAFFKGVNNYLTDPKLSYGFARTADLQRNLQKASGKNLAYFFNQWFYGEGYPSITVKWKDTTNNRLYFQVSQTTSVPSSVNFFKVRLPVQVTNGSQVKTFVLNCTANNQGFFVTAPGFTVQNVKIDPDNYLISANNTVIKLINVAAGIAALKITVNPNPVNSVAVVNLENMQGKTQLRLYNNAGNMLWSKLVENKTATQIQIPFSSFINGTYRLLVTEESGAQQSVTIVK